MRYIIQDLKQEIAQEWNKCSWLDALIAGIIGTVFCYWLLLQL